MKISVIIPVYNVERYLARCLDSVLVAVEHLSSDGHSAEIICVNDGSTDGCAGILERYRSTFNLQSSTFLILTKENGGLGSARNAGLDAMTGDYVMFVDSDDWIPSWALSRFAFVADASKAEIVASMAFAKDAAPPAPTRLDWTRRPVRAISGRKVQYCAWNKLYRCELFASLRYPKTIYEDLPVTTAALCAVKEFAAVEDPLYVYCTNGGAESLVRSAFTERKLRDSVTVVRMALKTSRDQRDPELRRFALRQAANGHSSTVGQVWKAKNPELRAAFLLEHAKLVFDFPELEGKLSLKASLRLWRMKHL